MDKSKESNYSAIARRPSSATRIENPKNLLQIKIVCDICESPKDVNSFCVNCEGTLCDKCKIKHKNGRISQHHRVILLSRKTFKREDHSKAGKESKDLSNLANTSATSKTPRQEQKKTLGVSTGNGSNVTKHESVMKREHSSALKRSRSARTVTPTSQKVEPSVKPGVSFLASEKTSNAGVGKKEIVHKDAKPVPTICKHHRKEEVVYCNLCCLPCCHVCAREHHRQHPVVELAIKLEAFNKELEKYTHHLETSVLAEYNRQLRGVSQDLRSYDESAQNTKRDLERDVKEVKVKMDALYDRYLKQVEQKIDNDRGKIREKKVELEQKITEVKQLIKSCKSKFSSKKAADLEFERECPTLTSFKLTPYRKPVPPTYVPVSKVDSKAFDSLVGKTASKATTPRQANPRSSLTEHSAQTGVCSYCGACLRTWEHPLSRHQVPFCPRCIYRS